MCAFAGLGVAVLWGATTVVVAFASFLAWFWLLARYPGVDRDRVHLLDAHLRDAGGWLLLAEPVSPALAVSILLVAAGIWTVNQRG